MLLEANNTLLFCIIFRREKGIRRLAIGLLELNLHGRHNRLIRWKSNLVHE